MRMGAMLLGACLLGCSGGGSGTSADAGSSAAGDGGVTACQASVDNERTVECTGTARQCIYAALRPFCATARTAYITAVFDCLAKYDGNACPSPSDPSNAQACIDQAMATYATSQDRSTGAVICGCEGASPETGCDAGLPQTLMATLMVMNPSDVAAYASCIQSQGCSQVNGCINQTPLAQANACPN